MSYDSWKLECPEDEEERHRGYLRRAGFEVPTLAEDEAEREREEYEADWAERNEAQARDPEDEDFEMSEKRMTVTKTVHGYNRTTVEGDCSPDVTVEDVKARFYDSYFGGSGAWVKDGRFGCSISGND